MVSTKVIFYFRRNRNLDEILSLFRRNFDVSMFWNFDFDVEIGISISIVSPKVEIIFDLISGRNSDEIDFGGNPSREYQYSTSSE
jgi:hypothetical protein